MTNLLPCPFCGGEAETDSYDDRAGTFDQCSQCFARVPGDGWNRRATVWQPIETAPKDCGRVLVYDPISGRQVASQGWSNEYPDDIRWEGVNNTVFYPTHWQPLPPPPSERAA